MKKSVKRRLDALVEDLGGRWELVRNSRHTIVRVYGPQGKTTTATIAVSPSDHRAFKNLAAHLKKELSPCP